MSAAPPTSHSLVSPEHRLELARDFTAARRAGNSHPGLAGNRSPSGETQ